MVLIVGKALDKSGQQLAAQTQYKNPKEGPSRVQDHLDHIPLNVLQQNSVHKLPNSVTVCLTAKHSDCCRFYETDKFITTGLDIRIDCKCECRHGEKGSQKSGLPDKKLNHKGGIDQSEDKASRQLGPARRELGP